MSSGDDIVAGQITTAEKTTDLVGALPNPPNVPFDGDAIFIVVPQQGELAPHQTLDGIHGFGTNGGVQQGSLGGTGVAGFGGPNQGTGVLGKGGAFLNGFGGIGVDGRGGNGSVLSLGRISTDPGTGVTGRGGLQDEFETTGRPHAAGVVGVAGNGPFPSFMDSGSVGVVGQGGNADRKKVNINKVPGTAGPKAPGVGVLGIGATQSDDGVVNGPGGAGVVGVAGGVANLPSMDDYGDAGVFGKSDNGRGGVFKSTNIAPLRLVPAANANLPVIGQMGDLFVSVVGDDPTNGNGSDDVTMWLCIVPSSSNAGVSAWVPFQFGPVRQGGTPAI
jgi:hypothetical protein